MKLSHNLRCALPLIVSIALHITGAAIILLATRHMMQLPQTPATVFRLELKEPVEVEMPYEENPCGGKAQAARISARDRAAQDKTRR